MLSCHPCHVIISYYYHLLVFANHTHVNTALHHQALPNMYNCSLCEVDSYVPIFGLSQEDVKLLKEYMRYYEIMRQCCGFQQSIYNRYRLHGCNVTQLLIDQPDIHYPHCEQHDPPKLEKEFDALPLTHSHFKDNYRWKKPGDCAHFDKEIIPGRHPVRLVGVVNRVYKFEF